MDCPERVMEAAKKIHEEASEFNSMTWDGPYRHELEEAILYVWRKAYDAGYREGCEDSY